jgi:hypothetical protein
MKENTSRHAKKKGQKVAIERDFPLKIMPTLTASLQRKFTT